MDNGHTDVTFYFRMDEGNSAKICNNVLTAAVGFHLSKSQTLALSGSLASVSESVEALAESQTTVGDNLPQPEAEECETSNSLSELSKVKSILDERKSVAAEAERERMNKELAQKVFSDIRALNDSVEANLYIAEQEVLQRDKMAFIMGQGQWSATSLKLLQVILE
jgi:hypothetical protein